MKLNDKKRSLFLLSLLLVISMILVCLYVPGALAATMPTITVKHDSQQEIVMKDGQKEFDMSALFEIDKGSYTDEQLNITYSLTKTGSGSVTLQSPVIDFVSGEYELIITIRSNPTGQFPPVNNADRKILFKLSSNAPSFRNSEQLEGTKNYALQLNQSYIDLSRLYQIDNGSFSEKDYKVSYDVKNLGIPVDVYGHNFLAITTTYTVAITIEPVEAGRFENVISPTFTLAVTKESPEVIFGYQTEEYFVEIDDEYDLELAAGTPFINLKEYFIVFPNAFLAHEFGTYMVVEIQEGEDWRNIAVTNGAIPAVEGAYRLQVRIEPATQGAFLPVVSKPIIINAKKASPKITNTVVNIREYEEGTTVNLSKWLSLSAGGYTLSDFTVSYLFVAEKGGKEYVADGNSISLPNGNYQCTATISSNSGAFSTVTNAFDVVVDAEVPTSVVSLVLWITIPSVVFCGACVFVILFLVKRKKRQGE